MELHQMGHTVISTSIAWTVWQGKATDACPRNSVFAAYGKLTEGQGRPQSEHTLCSSPQFSI